MNEKIVKIENEKIISQFLASNYYLFSWKFKKEEINQWRIISVAVAS